MNHTIVVYWKFLINFSKKKILNKIDVDDDDDNDDDDENCG